MTSSSREFDFLRRLCSPNSDLGAANVRLFEQVDRQRFLELVEWHQVAPLVAERLRSHNLCLDFLPEIRERSLWNTTRALKLSAELLSIVSELRTEGITAVPFKGPVLSERLFGNLAQREFVDLDVFVRKTEVSRAAAAMARMGYRPEREFSAFSAEQFQKSECEWALHSDEGTTVELHWDIAPRMLAYDVNWGAIWARTETGPFCGRTLAAFSDTDLMLLLLLHGSKHGWSRLKWIVDIAQFISVADIDYEALLRQARSTGCKRAVLVGLELAAQLLNGPLPLAVAKACEADALVTHLVTRISHRLQWPKPYSDAALLNFRVSVRERQMDQLRVVARTIFSPNQADDHHGPKLLHHLSRPIRLVRKRLGGGSHLEAAERPSLKNERPIH